MRVEDCVDIVWGANEIEACDDLWRAGDHDTRRALVGHTGLLDTAEGLSGQLPDVNLHWQDLLKELGERSRITCAKICANVAQGLAKYRGLQDIFYIEVCRGRP